MSTELQNKAWASLPPESRNIIREYQRCSQLSGHTKELLDIVFGYDNVLTDDEPLETDVPKQK